MAFAASGYDKDFFYFAGAALGTVVLARSCATIKEGIAWRLCRDRIRDQRILAAILLAPALWFLGSALLGLSPQGRASETLSRGRLAPLPASANSIPTHSWKGML